MSLGTRGWLSTSAVKSMKGAGSHWRGFPAASCAGACSPVVPEELVELPEELVEMLDELPELLDELLALLELVDEPV